ncbi:MAG: hypothetical protein M3145_00860, partial [Pseudomonadota bacterium]|nr:hypothetical protein [Pseudomonadota bacterium]
MTIRRLARLLLVGAALAAVPAAPAATMPAEARTADLDRFFDALAPYGTWMSIQPYGTVWVPDVSETWRPYER